MTTDERAGERKRLLRNVKFAEDALPWKFRRGVMAEFHLENFIEDLESLGNEALQSLYEIMDGLSPPFVDAGVA